ncbi:Bgt-1602 [Blumeria graminis f. sp. tritici]|uniref:Bgt-1602 n=2 Tax=Blumeria graminis f. sp. tritici TaxID=62690 RepID=A0A9X9L6T4_BLUGR|nr:hypothetical protein BGT96224_1602 [Blumeria graminis f. sp. tritici 96224]VCU38760.1 Bgt-1602 [Blumeria graminis f. sp. tritici]
MAITETQVSELIESCNVLTDDEDSLIASLENDDSSSLIAYREERIQQLHNEYARAKAYMESGYGIYSKIRDEKELMDTITRCKYTVLHFAKDDFSRCATMDVHLEILAKAHIRTRFLKANVEDVPFLVTKLSIKVLPCVSCWIDGISVDKLVGFEGLGDTQSEITALKLEKRLLESGVIQQTSAATSNTTLKQLLPRKEKENEFDDEDDWD